MGLSNENIWVIGGETEAKISVETSQTGFIGKGTSIPHPTPYFIGRKVIAS